ncbi:MAG: hypothetical protein SF069_13750 [Phycisphaerae bacterium]|nr:hypothetical protein [Phycisphaerae bacterium]
MRSLLSLLGLQLVAGFGCEAPEGRATVIAGVPSGYVSVDRESLPPPNLLYGNRSLAPAVGEAFTARSDWPATDWGYRTQETTYYSTFLWDSQLGFDRFGGSVFQNNNSIRSGVFIR